MPKTITIIILFLLSMSIHAEEIIKSDQIKHQWNCFGGTFSDYDKWRTSIKEKNARKIKSEEQLKKFMASLDSMFGKEQFNQYKATLACRNFQYTVNGHLVNGYVIKPKSTQNKLPVLIYNRGGNENFGGVVFASMMRNLFPIAAEGFIIIGSQYRGTFMPQSTVGDEFGGADVEDVISLLEFIPDIESADPERIGMYGASRGGMQTFLILKKSKNIKAVATIAGNSDLLKGLKERPKMERVYKARIPNYEQDKVAELEKRSVLKWVDELPTHVPVLLMHGTNDTRVDVSHSKELAVALEKHDIPHKLVLFEGDNHTLSKNKTRANKELVKWFRDHL
ncbi:hypothetical protein GCM10011365_01670 [Marinicella pacifica]|uniref:Peptidase S9 prolyl oligopeptidase catalytic domain-containing protein n=1 Tax=Marinicella pacifica TaxID=1171543 RepID=A0A917CDN2_9GAMM|nr:prolyl oligopeptidase family serine peptidase [Marinicella pacifica]GGF84381.1 hypothetical protein GCM10011365_01670 [Marinicella pacifica]